MENSHPGELCNHKPSQSIGEAAKQLLKDKNCFRCKYCGETIQIRKWKTKMGWMLFLALLNPPGYVFYFFTPNKALGITILLDILLELFLLLLLYKCSTYEKI